MEMSKSSDQIWEATLLEQENRLLDDEETISDDVRRQVSQAARRHGLQIITRAARAPWIQG